MPQKKNQSKLQKLGNWLKPTSPKKGMLLFAIVFAVLGGGYMAYKSFAATTGAFSQKVGNISNESWRSMAFSTTRGAVLFKSNMDTTPWGCPSQSYYVRIQELISGTWIDASVTKSASANGNLDIMTFDQGIVKGTNHTYSVFIKNRSICNESGTIWVDPTVDPDNNGY